MQGCKIQSKYEIKGCTMTNSTTQIRHNVKVQLVVNEKVTALLYGFFTCRSQRGFLH